MTRAEQIAAALAEVRERIAAAARRAGRSGDTVRLIAVSKRMPAEDVRAALAAGQQDFGENYAQELRDKRAALDGDIRAVEMRPRWHYLGPLQSNKVKYLAGQVELIQSVDSAATLTEIDRRLFTQGGSVPELRQGCLVQVNVAGESRKSGVSPQGLPALLDRFSSSLHAVCLGLMLIPPASDDPQANRRHFAGLRELAAREAAIERPHVRLSELSMGMSGDFVEAVAEGATLVRVGTAIFGARAAPAAAGAGDR